jgi:hypothetical protein
VNDGGDSTAQCRVILCQAVERSPGVYLTSVEHLSQHLVILKVEEACANRKAPNPC